MVLPLIIAYGPGSTFSRSQGGGQSDSNLFFGKNLADEAQMQEQIRAVSVDYWLKTGGSVSNPQEFKNLILERIVKLNLADRLAIPSPSADQLTIYIAGLPPFLDEKGFFSKKKYSEFESRFVKEAGLSKDFLTERIAECWRLEQLTHRMEGAAFYLPSSLQRQYSLTASRYSIQTAVLLPKVDTTLTVTNAEAQKYFEEHKTKYVTGEKRDGIVYKLSSDKFLSQVKDPSEEQLQRYFDAISLRFVKWQLKDEKGNIQGADPKAPVFSEHREETLKLYRQAKAARTAAEAVDALTQKLYSEKVTPNSKEWNTQISTLGLSSENFADLTIESNSTDPETITHFLKLNEAQTFGEAFQTENDGRFVLLTKFTPSTPQTYEQVAAQVKTDALNDKQQKALQTAQAEKIKSLQLAYEVAKKTHAGNVDFIEIAKKQGFSVNTPEAFTLQRPPNEINSEKLMRGLISAKAGELISDQSTTQATVVLLKSKETPAWKSTDPEAFQTKAQVENIYKKVNSFALLNEWADKNAGK